MRYYHNMSTGTLKLMFPSPLPDQNQRKTSNKGKTEEPHTLDGTTNRRPLFESRMSRGLSSGKACLHEYRPPQRLANIYIFQLLRILFLDHLRQPLLPAHETLQTDLSLVTMMMLQSRITTTITRRGMVGRDTRAKETKSSRENQDKEQLITDAV